MKDNERRKWINAISPYRRKGFDDTYDPTNKDKYFVCEFHFKLEDIRVSIGIGRKTLKPGVVPTIFKFKNPETIKPRKSPKKRSILVANESPEENSSSTEEEVECANPNDILSVTHFEPDPQDEIRKLNECIKKLKTENTTLKAEKDYLQIERLYNYENISTDPKQFKKATGLDLDSFKHVFVCVKVSFSAKHLVISKAIEFSSVIVKVLKNVFSFSVRSQSLCTAACRSLRKSSGRLEN